ncbi:hypothetical protein CFBP6624_03805 [Agrobacterium tumefaciens]|uniref:Uncharacterized protein n=1 Tax=Agrobacterium tumefaciens TaxID=358 RepID=A0AAE6BJ46_AGRTU|nr:hypothetical protein CFBP6624_03805 [Agrobacterium tumefaciens]
MMMRMAETASIAVFETIGLFFPQDLAGGCGAKCRIPKSRLHFFSPRIRQDYPRKRGFTRFAQANGVNYGEEK